MQNLQHKLGEFSQIGEILEEVAAEHATLAHGRSSGETAVDETLPSSLHLVAALLLVCDGWKVRAVEMTPNQISVQEHV